MTDPAASAAPGGPSVVRAEVRLVDLRLRRPHRAAHGTVVERPSVLVSLTLADGTVGWGECPALPRPTYSAEYARGAFDLLVRELLPAAVAGRPADVVGHPMATGAVADALLDATLRRDGRRLAAALGATRSQVPVRAVVSGTDLDDLVAAVAEALDAGYGTVGVKVDPDALVAPLAALRSTWPDLGVALDGNGTLADIDATTWRAIDDLAPDLVEQPCPPHDWLGSAAVAARLACPVVLDESILGIDDLETAVALSAAGGVSVKPARLGGVAAAAQLVGDARSRGLHVQVGGMLESAVGRAVAVAVAALDACDLPTHLAPSRRYWEHDVAEPGVTGSAGCVEVPTGPGIGCTPDPRRLDEATRERAVVDGG